MDQDKKNMDPPDGGYGWIIIIACILITTCVAPFQQCFGLIYERPFREMDISATTISFILNLYNSIMCILAFTAGPLLKKWNFKQIALAGCFASCTGITLTVFANSLGFLIVSFCLLQGIGIGFITQSVSLAKNVYFKKRLTLAMTCSVTGTGLLPIVMPQITTYLLNFYGTRNTILIFAAISYHSVIGALLLRPIKNKKSTNTTIEDIFVVSQQHRNETQSLTNKNNSVCSKIYKLLDLELFKDRSFVILVIGLSISYVAELNFNLINPFVLSQLSHLSTKDVALAMSVQATGDICGRLFLPLISFKFKCPSKIMFVVTLIGSCVGRAVLVCFSDVRVVVISISILLGLAKGGRAVYQSLVLPEYVSIETLPVATGFVMILNGVLSLALGPLIGLIHDVTGTYAYSLYSVSVLSMFCVVLLLLDNLFQKIIRKKLYIYKLVNNLNR